MGNHTFTREQALLSQAALREAAKARARQLHAEAMDEFFAAIGRWLRTGWRRLGDVGRRAFLRPTSRAPARIDQAA